MSEHAFLYEFSDIPDGMTLREWRAVRTVPRARRHRLRHLLRRH